MGLDMNDIHYALTYVSDISLIGDDIRTIGRNTNLLLNACKDIGFVVNAGKTKNVELGRHRGMITNKNFTIGSNSYDKWKPVNI